MAARLPPGAITYLDLGTVQDTLRTVPIVGKTGTALLPDAASVRDGSCPLARPLFVYARAGARPEVAAFLQWLQGDAGRAASERAGLVAMRR